MHTTGMNPAHIGQRLQRMLCVPIYAHMENVHHNDPKFELVTLVDNVQAEEILEEVFI